MCSRLDKSRGREVRHYLNSKEWPDGGSVGDWAVMYKHPSTGTRVSADEAHESPRAPPHRVPPADSRSRGQWQRPPLARATHFLSPGETHTGQPAAERLLHPVVRQETRVASAAPHGTSRARRASQCGEPRSCAAGDFTTSGTSGAFGWGGDVMKHNMG